MIGYFVEPFPDETLQSITERFLSHNHIVSRKQLIAQLFGIPKNRISIDLPAGLISFSENVKHLWLSDNHQILQNHTLWPFYSHFTNTRRHDKIIDSLMTDIGVDVHSRVGINASSLTRNKYPMVCPACMEVDLMCYREYYFHRIHQIPSILICPHHNANLVPIKPFNNYRSLHIDFSHVNSDYRIIENNNHRLLELSLTAKILLFDIQGSVDKAYKESFHALGYSRGKFLDMHSIKSKFRLFYGKDLLLKFGWNIDLWIPAIIANPYKYFNPWQHLLLGNFLKELDQKPKFESVPQNLFGAGPWKCKNKAAAHYGESVVKHITIHIDKKNDRYIALLKCKCGMIYSRSFLNNAKKNLRIETIREWGHLWKRRVFKETRAGKSLREVSRLVGSDPSSVSRILRQNGVAEMMAKMVNVKSLKANRNAWKQIFRKIMTSTVLMSKRRKLYAWLYRNDRRWLLEFNSHCVKRHVKGKLRANWASLDNSVVSELQAAHRKLLFVAYKGRVSKTRLLKEIGKEHYLSKTVMKKLPNTANFLLEFSESIEQYQVRRIVNIIRTDETLRTWEVSRKAGLSKKSVSLVQVEFDKQNPRYGYYDTTR